jgi:ABC-type nitrate/sulfonate/bicarbonate transport system ATPase subunit
MKPRDCICLLGPSGIGKTTLLNAISALVRCFALKLGLLLLNEPFESLDPVMAGELKQRIVRVLYANNADQHSDRLSAQYFGSLWPEARRS